MNRRGAENLANAIVHQAAWDYELLISDKPLPVSINNNLCNLEELKIFARDQKYVDMDVNGIYETINRHYKEFRQIVSEHAQEIIDEWNKYSPERKDDFNFLSKTLTYKCPNCGHFLRPGNYRQNTKGYIVCSFCNLNMRIPKGVKY